LNAREEILKAADTLFGKVGYEAASTREIAELSGVNKALIHYHFRTKEALFESVLDRYYERLNRTLRAVLDQEGTLRERMEHLIEVYVDFLARHRNFIGMVQREASGGPHLERIVTHMVPIFQTGTEAVHQAYPATRAGALSASRLLTSFYGMIVTYFTYSPVLKRLLGSDPLSQQNLAGFKRHLLRMLDLVAKALEAENAPARSNPGRNSSTRRKS